MREFSRRHRFSDWPNADVPAIAAGVYAIWDGDRLVYCGMSGRGLKKAASSGKSKFGLVKRLTSHASGRLGGDQFCVYVANRLIIPQLTDEQRQDFRDGRRTLDAETRRYVNDRLEYQFACVDTDAEAYALEKRCRRGEYFGDKPALNPL